MAWKAQRKKIQEKRIKQGKKPLIDPLTIVSAKERRTALSGKKLIFRNGKKKIEVNLVSKIFGCDSAFQGIYKTHDGKLILLRGDIRDPLKMADPKIRVMQLHETKSGFREEPIGWAFKKPDLGHIQIAPGFEGQGLATTIASKTVKHVRAGMRGTHKFNANIKFKHVFRKLGYKVVATPDKQTVTLQKYTSHPEKNNLDKYHRIEAIDSKTKRKKLFTFEIKK